MGKASLLLSHTAGATEEKILFRICMSSTHFCKPFGYKNHGRVIYRFLK